MMQITGEIITEHHAARCVAEALAPDNLKSMVTQAHGDQVITTIAGTQVRSVIASVDDYLMMLAIAEDTCSYVSQ
ncbi:MAG: KEOPS complex subunit Pcc1 [Methanoregula sp.]|jgi:hypothetical protein